MISSVFFSQDGIPQVGYAYLYDHADYGGYIFNDSGAYMKLSDKSPDVAIVKLPPDDEYREPALRSSWFKRGVNILRASECVGQGSMLSLRLASAVSNIYVISSVGI